MVPSKIRSDVSPLGGVVSVATRPPKRSALTSFAVGSAFASVPEEAAWPISYCVGNCFVVQLPQLFVSLCCRGAVHEQMRNIFMWTFVRTARAIGAGMSDDGAGQPQRTSSNFEHNELHPHDDVSRTDKTKSISYATLSESSAPRSASESP